MTRIWRRKAGGSWWATRRHWNSRCSACLRRFSEKDRRRYAAVEAAKLGHGGVGYMAQLFDIDPKTVRRGLRELEHPDDSVGQRVRKPGGGRTSALEHGPQLEDHFLRLLAEFTAGDPMREGVLWTNLSRREISRRLREIVFSNMV